MATPPWTGAEQATPGTDAVVPGSRLELRTHRHAPASSRVATKVRRRVRSAFTTGTCEVSDLRSPQSNADALWRDAAQRRVPPSGRV